MSFYTFTIKDGFEILLDITISKEVLVPRDYMADSLLEKLFQRVFQIIREEKHDIEVVGEESDKEED